MNNRAILALVAASAALVGCVPTVVKQLPEESRTAVAPTAVIVNLPQREINMEIIRSQTTAAMGGGLLWALVDSAVDNSRATDAEKNVQPARDALIGFDVDGLVREEARKAYTGIAWLGAQDVTVTRHESPDWREQVIAATPTNSHLFVHANYTLSPDASRITFTVRAELYSLSPAFKARIADRLDGQGKKPSSPLVADQVRASAVVNFESSLPAPSKDHPTNIAVWAADGGKLLREAITAAAQRTNALLAAELDRPVVDPKAAGAKPARVKVRNISYDLVEKADGVTVARGGEGTLWVFHTASQP
jgi:hypothetical protein